MSKRTVLIAENDGIISLDIINILKSIHCKSVLARTEKELLEQYRKNTPALIIADLFLNKVSNEEVLKQIGNDNRTPIIIVSGSARSVVEKIAGSISNCTYLQKPFDKSELLALAKHYLDGKS